MSDRPSVPQTSTEGGSDPTTMPVWLAPLIRKTIWRLWWAVILGLVVVWAYGSLRHVINLVLVSVFFSLALAPGAQALRRRFGMRRGTAVLLMYLGGIVFILVLVLVFIPAMIEFAAFLREQFPAWIESFNQFTQSVLGWELFSDEWATETADQMGTGIAAWAGSVFGLLTGFAASGIGLLFDVSSVAMFTFYLTAGLPKIHRALLSRLSPARQQPIGWAWDQAIAATGVYFYARLVVMIVNGSTFLVVLLLVGMPVSVAIGLALFESFIATFIPAVGTYIGAAVPIIVVLAAQGWQAALILLIWTLIYQSIENFVLTPRISASTMHINDGVAYGAVLVGGALAGPFGAFVSLPIAALVASFVANYAPSYEVAYRSDFDESDEVPLPAGPDTAETEEPAP